MNTTAQWQVDPKQPVFDGHFPEFPIMPGVMLIGFIKAHIFNELNIVTEVANIKRFRFVKPVLPGDSVTTTLKSVSENGDELNVSCACTVGETIVAKGTITLRKIS